MIVNSKIKKKSKTISGVIRNLVFDASLEEVSKKNYDKQFTTAVTTHKNVQNYHNEKGTYNLITHCILLYALIIWDCLNFIRKKRLIFLA